MTAAAITAPSFAAAPVPSNGDPSHPMQVHRAIFAWVFKLAAVQREGGMRQRRTRTGARRSGDDYQDLVAAKALLRILKHPSRYLWVKFEDREAGTLDDVLVLRTDDVVEASQVKFSTDALRPGDPLTWEKLLRQPEGKKLFDTSLV